jgi:polyribonucleotide nucleotidyltransferase
MYKKVSAQFHGRELTLEAGKMARQASGSVFVRYGDSQVLVTAVADQEPGAPGDFIPITVNYQEKFYASGKIPGGFFKREGRPTDVETLNCRLIDRPLRPLFPKNWFYETQIMPTVLSADQESNPGVLALIGASAALEISHIPFDGPVAAVQVARLNGQWIINPGYAQMEESDVALVVAGNRLGITMVEGGASMAPEEEILEGLFLGYESLGPVFDLQDELRQAVGVPKTELEPIKFPEAVVAKIEELTRADMEKALTIPGKMERHLRLREIRKAALAALAEKQMDPGPANYYFMETIYKMEREILRKMIIERGQRVDGRAMNEVRPIACEIGVLPRTHGSSLFTRGETQALVVATLGTRKDERKIERLEDEYWKSFYLHYNFPPYSVGEISGRLQPGRREIGHGYLAERALARVLPEHDDFPYTIRVVSDITESNGSSSMATVCGGSLSLMDAGVPIKGQVAGIAMGLIKEAEGKYHVLTDIMGDEDHCGDMDFKVAGTAEGVTALQMDIKISGVNREVMSRALAQAKEARLTILARMNEAISAPRPDLSPFAPRIITIKIPIDKIKDVIGPGGKMIRSIVEETGATIDVEDDGTVRVASADAEANKRALEIISNLTAVPEAGKIYTGTVKRVTDFGAFVEILPGTDGLLHISRIENRRIEKVTDVLHEGDTVVVKCLSVDQDGKISLSRKDVLELQPGAGQRPDAGRQPDAGRRPDAGRQPDAAPSSGGEPPRGSRPYNPADGRGPAPDNRGPRQERDKRRGPGEGNDD